MPLYPNSSLPQTLNVSVQGPDLPKVSSIDELDKMATQANSRYVFFDDSDDLFYIVSTNGNNFKTVNRYRFYEDPVPKPEDNYATKDEINELKGMMNNVQLSIQQLINSQSNTSYKNNSKHGGQTGSNKANVSNDTELSKSNGNA